MRTRLPILVLTAALLTASGTSARASWGSYDRPARYGVVSETNLPITMPDGTRLSANIYRPDSPGRYPVLLFQNPYGSNGVSKNDGGASDPYLVQRGYVQVVVDVRGTGQSEGTWDPFGPAEQRDGFDLVEWAARQPWSDGNVAGAGGSYLAIAQILTAAQRPPHLKAILPFAPVADVYRDMVMIGGSVDTSFIPAWIANVGLGMVQAPPPSPRGVESVPAHAIGVADAGNKAVVEPMSGDQMAYDGAWWGLRSPIEVADRIRVPTFVVGGLHDIFQRGEPLLYERVKRNVPARLLIGPWMHLNYWSGLPADGVPAFHELELRWYDRWLKNIDTHLGAIPQVTQYSWGLGHYVASQDWPNPRMQPLRLFMRGGGRLRSDAPHAVEPPQSFPQNPATGACTLSTSQWTAGAGGYLPCEQEAQPDRTVGQASYESGPLPSDLRLDGPLLADIWMRTTATDAPITARIYDVAPDGSSFELTDGWLSAGYRATDPQRNRYHAGRLFQPWHPFTADSVLPVKPNEPMELPVEVFPTNALVRAGHRLRVTIASGDFPHQVAPGQTLAASLAGTATVLTDPQHPSSITLPAVGASCALGRQRGGTCRTWPTPRLLRGG
ncbi:MAG TPA: CocE/NonD family hydrolase [Thermoleophilaceae bacterium]|nr:CocE/NonD family hydrolase [Thermoleophilaceae bacterium]